MQNENLQIIERYNKKRKQYKRWQKVVACLSCLVLLGTSYALILPAISMTPTAYCGMEEHHHDESCYEKKLICGYEDAADGDGDTATDNEIISEDEGFSDGSESEHIHTDECYEEINTLVCGMDESDGHVHTSDCLDDDSDLATPSDADEILDEDEEYVCGLEAGEGEHHHSEDCYEVRRVLNCPFSESDNAGTDLTETAAADLKTEHIHTENCYKKVLICDLPEHEHTLACYSNPDADLETSTDWERSVSGVQLTGVWADDVVAIAESQIGYKESKENYLVDENESMKGITRYGQWYGDPYGDWCAMFVSFCLHYAEVPENVIPPEADCEKWAQSLESSDRYSASGDYTPEKGDLIFFDLDEDGTIDHVGITEKVEKDDMDDVVAITSIEGNATDMVKCNNYSISDERLVGYGLLSQTEKEIANTSSKVASNDFVTSVTMEKKVGGEWVDAKEFTDGDEVKIKITYKVADGSLPADDPELNYQLPDGIVVGKEETGKITGRVNGNDYQEVGTYTIDTDGKVTLKFNDDFFLMDGDFWGGIQFEGKVSVGEDDTEKEIIFVANGEKYTIKPDNTDLTVKKTASQPEDGKIIYTVTVSSKKGSGIENITFEDTLKYEHLTSIDVKHPTVKKNDGSSVSYADYTTSSDEGSEKISMSLPPLSAGESYTISYEVDYGEIVGDGYAKVENTAIGSSDDKQSKDSIRTEISHTMISKSGKATDNNQYILWEVLVNPYLLTGYEGEYTLSDLLDGQDIDLSNVKDLQIIENDFEHEWTKTDVTDSAYHDGKFTMRKGCAYFIYYKTPVDWNGQDTVTVSNTMTIEKDGHSYSDSAQVKVTAKDLFESKTAASQQVSDDGNYVEQTWNVKLNPRKGSKDAITLTDRLTDSSDNLNASVHYTNRQLLVDSFNKWKDVFSYSLTCYDEDGNEVTDNNTPVVSFSLMITPIDVWTGELVVIDYQSYFAIDGLDGGEQITVKNTATVGDVSHSAESSYKKPKDFAKYVYGSKGWHTGPWKFDYDEIKQELKYRVVVKPGNMTEFTVTDTIPDGMTLSASDVAVKFTDEENSRSDDSISINGTTYEIAGNTDIQVDGQKLTVTIKNVADTFYAIEYTVKITDEFWDDLKNNKKTYVNNASWNGKNEKQESTIERDTTRLEKTGEQLTDDEGRVTNQVRYYVTINQNGEKLNDGKPLELQDTLQTNGVGASLDLGSVKLYSYDAENANDHYKGSQLSPSSFQFRYDEKAKTFTAMIPDELPCVLEYMYTIDDMNHKTEASWSNSATLMGETSAANKISIKEGSSSAWAVKDNGLTLVKIDADRYQVTLPGAEFKLEKYNWSDWETVDGTYITGEDGTCRIELSAITAGTLYRLSETVAPDGYSVSDKKYYFVHLGDGNTADNWQVPYGVNVEKSDITFIGDNHYATIYVPNKYSTIKVSKIWLNSDGSPMNGTQDVRVQLYQNKTRLDYKTVKVRLAGPNFDHNYKEITYQVKPGTNFLLKLQYYWDSSNTNAKIGEDGPVVKMQTDTSVSGGYQLDCGTIDDDEVIMIGGNEWVDFYSGICVPVYTKAEYVTAESIEYGPVIRLTSENGYSYNWTDLPDTVDGNPVYYTVKEVGTVNGYITSYLNNEGIQTGEITITNKADEISWGYELPETGGPGTTMFTVVGMLLIGASLLYKYWKCRFERREK